MQKKVVARPKGKDNEDDEFTINRLRHRDGERNESDLFTKALPADKHWWCVRKIGMTDIPNAPLGK